MLIFAIENNEKLIFFFLIAKHNENDLWLQGPILAWTPKQD